MSAIPDHRKRRTYDVAEILMGGIFMFLMKRGSRNNADKSVKKKYEKNYIALWGLRLPIMETVEKFLRELPAESLEFLKKELVQTIIRRKSFNKGKYNGKHLISIDGTGVMSFDYEPFEGCPYKTSKTGKVTWTAYILEAKLVCSNGLCISLATEWLNSNENIGDEKQDCELKAFKRIAAKIKNMYPRLPIIILADSLYPNKTTFEICRKNKWNFIFTFKNGCLPTVWREIESLRNLSDMRKNQQERYVLGGKPNQKERSIFICDIIYADEYKLNWLEYEITEDNEQTEYFSHITDIDVNSKNVWEVSRHGRLRWIIENQGFNCQKNQGYNMQHKYARKHLSSMKNFYQLLQIAHMIEQLTLLQTKISDMMQKAGITIKAAFEDIVAFMKEGNICKVTVDNTLEKTKQLRY